MSSKSMSPLAKNTRLPTSTKAPTDSALAKVRDHRQSASWGGSPTEWDHGSSSGHVSNEHVQSGLIPTDHQLPATLLDQGLTSKGQPKRPMNAFLIFARWRRPILKEENPSLSTGEISTLLSQDWASMDAVTRDFYSSHALALKATFQSRYPAYEYTRRPNNTRKRGSRGGKTYISRRDSSSWKSSDDTSASTMLGGSALGLESIGPMHHNGSLGWKRNRFSKEEAEEDSDTDTNRHDNDGSSSSQYSDHSQGNRPTSSTHSELPTPQLPYYPLTTEYGPPNELSSSAPAFYKPNTTSFTPISAATTITTANNTPGTYGPSSHLFAAPYSWQATQVGPISSSFIGSSPYSPPSSLSSFSPQLDVNGRLHGHGKIQAENGTNHTYMATTQNDLIPRPSPRRPDVVIEPSSARQSEQQLATATTAADPSASSFRSNTPYHSSARNWSTDSFRRYPDRRARTGPLNAPGFLNTGQQQEQQQQQQSSSSYKWSEPDGNHHSHSVTVVADEGRPEGRYRAGGVQVENGNWNSSHQEESTYLPTHSPSHPHYPSDQLHTYPLIPPPASTTMATPTELSLSMSSAPIGVSSTSSYIRYPNNLYPPHSHSQSLISASAPTTSLSSLMYSPYQQNSHHLQPISRISTHSSQKTDRSESFVNQPLYQSSDPDPVRRTGPSDQDLMGVRTRESPRHPNQTNPQGHAKFESWSGSVNAGASARDRTPMMDSYYYES